MGFQELRKTILRRKKLYEMKNEVIVINLKADLKMEHNRKKKQKKRMNHNKKKIPHLSSTTARRRESVASRHHGRPN